MQKMAFVNTCMVSHITFRENCKFQHELKTLGYWLFEILLSFFEQ